MLRWVQIHGVAVETIVACGGSPYTEATLSTLLSCCFTGNTTVSLKHAYCRDITDASISLLGWCCRITTIELQATLGKSQELDLQPLQRLPHLASLELESGKFSNMNTLSCLTSLSAADCQLEYYADCASVTSLVQLVLRSSQLKSFHTSGLAACSKLQHLDLCEVHIDAVHDAEAMAFFGTHFRAPRSLSALTALTSLLITYMSESERVDLQWLSQLPSLHSLCLLFEVQHVIFPESISRLSHMTYLRLSNTAGSGTIRVSCNWSRLVSLQVLNMTGAFQFDGDLCDLAKLVFLTSVVVEMLGTQQALCNRAMALQVGRLGHKLGARPNVEFILN